MVNTNAPDGKKPPATQSNQPSSSSVPLVQYVNTEQHVIIPAVQILDAQSLQRYISAQRVVYPSAQDVARVQPADTTTIRIVPPQGQHVLMQADNGQYQLVRVGAVPTVSTHTPQISSVLMSTVAQPIVTSMAGGNVVESTPIDLMLRRTATTTINPPASPIPPAAMTILSTQTAGPIFSATSPALRYVTVSSANTASPSVRLVSTLSMDPSADRPAHPVAALPVKSMVSSTERLVSTLATSPKKRPPACPVAGSSASPVKSSPTFRVLKSPAKPTKRSLDHVVADLSVSSIKSSSSRPAASSTSSPTKGPVTGLSTNPTNMLSVRVAAGLTVSPIMSSSARPIARPSVITAKSLVAPMSTTPIANPSAHPITVLSARLPMGSSECTVAGPSATTTASPSKYIVAGPSSGTTASPSKYAVAASSASTTAGSSKCTVAGSTVGSSTRPLVYQVASSSVSSTASQSQCTVPGRSSRSTMDPSRFPVAHLSKCTVASPTAGPTRPLAYQVAGPSMSLTASPSQCTVPGPSATSTMDPSRFPVARPSKRTVASPTAGPTRPLVNQVAGLSVSSIASPSKCTVAGPSAIRTTGLPVYCIPRSTAGSSRGPLRPVPTSASTPIPLPSTSQRLKQQVISIEKCRKFFTNLLNMTRAEHAFVAKRVQLLIQDLVNGVFNAGEFCERLEQLLEATPQPNLIDFLTRNMPYLRKAMVKGEIEIEFIDPPPPHVAFELIQPTSTQQKLQALANKSPSIELIQITSKSDRRNMVSPTLLSTLRSRLLEKLQTSKVSVEEKDYDDIMDITSMGGVNLAEESKFGSKDFERQTRSCKDEYFVPTNLLQARIKYIANKHGLGDSSVDVAHLMSHAVQERLKTIVEKLVVIAKHRNERPENNPGYVVTKNVRSQLNFLKEVDRINNTRREEAQREEYMRVAKSKNVNPEVKAKAKEMHQAVLEQVRHREANAAALKALGPRKKPQASSSQASTSTNGAQGIAASNVMRPRITHIYLRDMQFLMENEPELSRSPFLFASYLK